MENLIVPITIIAILLIGFIVFLSSTPAPQKAAKQEYKPQYLEVNLGELYATFSKVSPYTEIQKEEIYKRDYGGKLLKATIRADSVNKASLGSNYVVLEMLDSFNCYAKAFFPSSEKGKLLSASIGISITFTGKLTSYKFGFGSCTEFGDAKVLSIS